MCPSQMSLSVRLRNKTHATLRSTRGFLPESSFEDRRLAKCKLYEEESLAT